MKTGRSLAPALLATVVCLPACASIETVPIEDALPYWNNPATVEPLHPEDLILLEADLGHLLERANQAYNMTDFELAARYYLLFIRADLNRNPIALYNLACCYSLMGETELASHVLLMAVDAGMTDLGFIDQDPDFDNIREHEMFEEVMAHAYRILGERAILESEEHLGQLLHITFPALQELRLHLPEDFDPGEGTYRAVVALHGYSGDAEEFSSRWHEFERKDFIYLSIQAPYAIPPEFGQGYSWIAHGSQEWLGLLPEEQRERLWERSAFASIDYVVAATEELRSHYDISEIYLLGFSQGGQFCYLAGLSHPDIFDGIGTFTAPFDEMLLPEEGPGSVRIFIARGVSEDERGLLARDFFESQGYDVFFHEFEGAHWVPGDALRLFEDWMEEGAPR